jgi:hypothetical protein
MDDVSVVTDASEEMAAAQGKGKKKKVRGIRCRRLASCLWLGG